MNNNQQPTLVMLDSDTFELVEPNGQISMRIMKKAEDYHDKYRIRHYSSTQEIYDETGKGVARTSDPEMAEHIRRLLMVWEKHKQKLANESQAN